MTQATAKLTRHQKTKKQKSSAGFYLAVRLAGLFIACLPTGREVSKNENG